MGTATWLRHAAEIWSADPANAGPTGRFAEVLRGEVRDRGGNVLFAGTADACVAQGYRIPYRLVPTEWREVAGEVADVEHRWQLVTE